MKGTDPSLAALSVRSSPVAPDSVAEEAFVAILGTGVESCFRMWQGKSAVLYASHRDDWLHLSMALQGKAKKSVGLVHKQP